ncbi:MAG: prepilin-type N-terminal cleavage/methylation domain-containing protein [Lachnospiraceae bacterium]|nr:prepilin-type N-terminal cleavage/methylation domain-containing protein [Lachnospiraceae bacterium]
MKANSQNKGFTLIEMLVTVALLGIVMTMLTTFVTSSSRQYTRGTREARMQMEAQETMNFIEKLVTDGTADSGCFSFSSGTFTAYILKGTTLSKYVISFDPSEKMLRYSRQDKIYGAYDATAGKPIVEPGSATMNSGWSAVSRQNIPLSKYVSGFSVDLTELASRGMFRVNLEFSLEGADYSASRTYNIRNITEINERAKWINSLGEEDFDSEGEIFRGQTLNLNDYAKNILKLTDTYTSWKAKSGAENNDQIQTGSTAQITLENGVLTVKAGYDWNRDIKLQLVGETADGSTQTVNLHLSAVAIVGENKSVNKSDLVGTTLISNVKGINADNAGLTFKLFFSENKVSNYSNGFSGLSGITLESGQQSTLMSGGSAVVKVTTAKEVAQGAGISKNRLTVIPQEYNRSGNGYLYIVPYKKGTSEVIQTSGIAEIAISDGTNIVTPTEAPTEAPTQPYVPPTEPYVEPTTPAAPVELADEVVLENLKATVTGVNHNLQDWGFYSSFNVQLTGATGMSHNKLKFRVYVGSTSGISTWDRQVGFSQVSSSNTNLATGGSYFDLSGVVTVNDINQSEIETASVTLNLGPPFSESVKQYLNNMDKCVEVYYAGQLISPAASYSPTAPNPGGSGNGNGNGGGTTEPASDPNAPNAASLSARVENGSPKISASFVNTKGTNLSKLKFRIYTGDLTNSINIYYTGTNYQNAQIENNQFIWNSGGSSTKGSNYIEGSTGASNTIASESFSAEFSWSLGVDWTLNNQLQSILSDINNRIEIYYDGQLISARSKYH